MRCTGSCACCHCGTPAASLTLSAPLPASLQPPDKPSAFGGSSRAYASGPGAGKKAGPKDEGPGVAQQRFGNAKSISSSAFHGKDDKESEYEKQQRLSQFQVGAGASCCCEGRQTCRWASACSCTACAALPHTQGLLFLRPALKSHLPPHPACHAGLRRHLL